MSIHDSGLRSIDGVCEVEFHPPGDAQAGSTPALLIEVPHGATRGRHYAATRAALTGPLPDDLEAFFFVNTDVGAPECAVEVARRFVAPGGGAGRVGRAVIVCSLIPRTFADCNRLLDAAPDMEAGITPCIPTYVAAPQDRATLAELHRAYGAVAARAYEVVCGGGGLALQLHTYAPRTVRIEQIDEEIVRALRRAYEPERYATWELRPAVDLITRTADDTCLAPSGIAADLRRRFAEVLDEPLAENASYRLHPSTSGWMHAARYPGRTLCVELRRDLLVTEFRPFEEMEVDRGRARRLALPLADALRSELLRGSGA